MAPRRSAPTEEEEEMGQEGDLVSLQFKETLTWRAGNPIATGELHRRLGRLSKELKDLEQETTDRDSLTKVAKELVAQNLLGHKDKGVKAFVACCLVDILRICAPHAPFTHAQLKDVFSLFVTQILPSLQDPTNAYNSQYRHVLSSLADVQSIVLLNDVENNDGLLLSLFSSFFDSVSTPKAAIPRDVEHQMTEILTTLVEEGVNLPAKVVDVIMAQFLRAAAPGAGRDRPEAAEVDESQSTLLLKEEPPAYQMAKTICNACSDKMARFAAQYFSDVIMDYSGAGGRSNGQRGEDSDDEDPAGPTTRELTELRKAHLLLRELWRAAPLVVANVVPQLEAELSADNQQLRQLATETLGDMISGIGAAGPPPAPVLDPAAYPPPMLADDSSASVPANSLRTPSSPHSFAQTHPTAYHNFVNRRNDKAALIRATWVTAVGYVISTSAGGIGLSPPEEAALVRGLAEKLSDNDEKVRLAAVKAIEVFSFKDVIAKLAPDGGISKEGSVLGNLADRCRDRKSHVRVDAMVLLGKLWAAATGELAAGNEVVVSAFSAIPSRMLNVMYANDSELNVLLERVIFEYLVPLSFPPSKKKSKPTNGTSRSQAVNTGTADEDAVRAERILLLVRYLDGGAKRAFFAMQNRQPKLSKTVAGFVKLCELFNGGVMDNGEAETRKGLERTIGYLAHLFPDPGKVTSDLNKFAKINDRRGYQLVKWIIGAEFEFKQMQRSLRELTKRLQTTHPGILDSLVPVLYRSGSILLNRSHLSTILEHSRAGQGEMSATAQEMMNEISSKMPDLFKTHIVELCKDLSEQAPTAYKANDPTVAETLKACSSYAQKYPQEVSRDRAFTQALMSYALYGQPPRAAKHAVNILLATRDDDSMVSATELLRKATKGFSYGSPFFQNNLATVGQLALLAPDVVSDVEEDLNKEVLNIIQDVRTDAAASDPDWAEDADLEEECQVKLLCLKYLVKRQRSSGDGEEAQASAKSLLRMLTKFVGRGGEMCKTKDTPNHHKSRLRLAAAQSILKLCQQRQWDDLFTANEFNYLALVSQDGALQVRRAFISKLQKYLVDGKLRPRFYCIVFLTAFEGIQELKQRNETWIRSRVRQFEERKQSVLEPALARFLSLLAHHPDHWEDPEDLTDLAKYIIYYVSNVATESNAGLIYKYAERVKQTLDAIDKAKSERLYVLADLAQAIVRKWQEKRNWTFQAYPDKVGLPTGLYLPLPSHEVAQRVAEKQYIPESMDEELDTLLKAVDKKKKRKSIDDHPAVQGARPPPKRAKVQAKPGPPKEPKEPKEPKAAAPKKTAKAKVPSRPKKAAAPSSSAPSSSAADVDRRRSGRSARARQSYAERNSDDDDDEMLNGVAKWDYYKNDDEDGGLQQPPKDDGPEDISEEEEAAPEPMDEDDVEPEDVASEAEEDDESEPASSPPPTKANGRRGRAAAAASPAAKALAKAPSKAPVKAKARPAPKGKAPARTAPAKGAPVKAGATKGAARPTRPARKAKDVYDVEMDD